MGNNNINGDLSPKLKAIIADGKVEAKEVKGLTNEEKAELENYLKGTGQELPNEGEITYLKEPKILDVSGQKTQQKAGFFAPVLWLLTAAVTFLTSCISEDEPEKPSTIVEGNKTEINNNVSFEIKQDINALVNAINALKDADDVRHEELMKEIKSLKESLAQQKVSLDAIIVLLTNQGLKLEDIAIALNKAGESVDKIVEALVRLGKTTSEILEALKVSGAQLGDIAIQLKDNTEILKEISGKNTKIYNAIVDLMAQGERISGEYKAILNDILNKIGSQNASDLSKVEDMLATIINKLNQQITNQEEMSKVDQAFYDAVLAKLDGMTAEQKAFFNAVLAKLGDMDDAEKAAFEKLLAAIEKNTAVSEKTFEVANKILEAMDKDANGDYSDILNKILEKLGTINGGGVSSTDLTKVESLLEAILAKIDKSIDNQDKMAADNLEFYNTLLAKLDGMKGDQAEAFESLLEAIKENTEVAKGTFEVANKILAALSKLGDKADEAINVLKNLSTGGDCNFKPEDMKAFIEAVVKGLKDTYTAGNEKLLAKLDEILNKIPEGCKCDHSELLAKLEIIITKMEKPDSGDNSHEGIVGDLEDIFG